MPASRWPAPSLWQRLHCCCPQRWRKACAYAALGRGVVACSNIQTQRPGSSFPAAGADSRPTAFLQLCQADYTANPAQHESSEAGMVRSGSDRGRVSALCPAQVPVLSSNTEWPWYAVEKLLHQTLTRASAAADAIAQQSNEASEPMDRRIPLCPDALVHC